MLVSPLRLIWIKPHFTLDICAPCFLRFDLRSNGADAVKLARIRVFLAGPGAGLLVFRGYFDKVLTMCSEFTSTDMNLDQRNT